jgi:hypothetical protein
VTSIPFLHILITVTAVLMHLSQCLLKDLIGECVKDQLQGNTTCVQSVRSMRGAMRPDVELHRVWRLPINMVVRCCCDHMLGP